MVKITLFTGLVTCLVSLTVHAQELQKITLTSHTGKTFALSVDQAKLSGTLEQVIQENKSEPELTIPVPFYSDTLSQIILGLTFLEKIKTVQQKLHLAGAHEKDYSLYDIQPHLMFLVHDTSSENIIKLMRAANYLDIPALINAYAYLIAHNMPKIKLQTEVDPYGLTIEALEHALQEGNAQTFEAYKGAIEKEFLSERDKYNFLLSSIHPNIIKAIPELQEQKKFKTQQIILEVMLKEIDPEGHALLRKQDALEDLSKLKQVLLQHIPAEMIHYIKKHIFLRSADKQELTVADYLSKNPNVITELNKNGKVRLSNKNLTSLYGIHYIPHPETVTDLYLSDNSFLPPSEDTYDIRDIFAPFKNLQKLDK